MCDSNDVKIPDEILDQLRCSVCTQYLSCVPIQVLPNGRSICGNCGSAGSEETLCRCLTLETILSKVYFPCKFQNYGCIERLLFGKANEHQYVCDYREFPCPVAECLWKGAFDLLQEHFAENHDNLVLKIAEIKIDLEENKEEIVMVVIEDTNFMLKYQYNAAACHFYYDIRYFKSVKEASCKIRVLNNSDHDYSVTAKGNPAQLYDYGFYNKEVSNSNVLDISKLLPALNQPREILVVTDLKFTIDYSRLLLKCCKCDNHLAIPIFEDQGVTICASCCYEGCLPTSNNDVINQVANSVIPCRWNDCNVIKKGSKIREHERNCKKRVYKCLCCTAAVDRYQIDSHITTKHSRYNAFVGTCNYTFKMFEFSDIGFYTKIENDFIFIHTDYRDSKHCIDVNTTKYADNIILTVVVSHSHCNKSKQFKGSGSFEITRDMLPACFGPPFAINANIHVNFWFRI